jgi:hypothetical protein
MNYLVSRLCISSRFLSSDSSGQLDVSDHDSDSSGVDGAEVSVLEKTNQVGLDGLLEGKNGGALESDVSLNIASDVLDQSLERKLSDQEVGGSLVLSDFSDSNSSWSESVWLLNTSHSSGGWGLGLGGGDLLSWLLDSVASLSSGSLSSGHLCEICFGILKNGGCLNRKFLLSDF